MSVRCTAYIPNDVRIQDVVDVVSIFSGNKPFKSNRVPNWIEIPNTKFGVMESYEEGFVSGRLTGVFGMYQIYVPTNNIDNEFHFAILHTDARENHIGYYALSGGSNIFWKIICTGVAKFFGGYVDYNDCDNIDKDIEFEKPRKINCPEDGEAWRKFQEEKFSLEPLDKNSFEQIP